MSGPPSRIYEVLFPGEDEPFRGTMSEVAAKAGLKRRTIEARLERGYSVQEAIAPKWALPRKHGHDAVIDGVPVRGTVNGLAAMAGINVGTVQARLRRGIGLDRALSEPPRPKGTILRASDPETGEPISGTLPQLCARFGIGRTTVLARLESGMPLQQALETPPGAVAKRTPVRKSRHFRIRHPETGEILEGSAKEICARTGVRPDTAMARIRNGVPPDEALAAPNKRPSSTFEVPHPETGEPVSGTPYALSRLYGTDPGRTYRLLHAGYGILEALESDPLPRGRKAKP